MTGMNIQQQIEFINYVESGDQELKNQIINMWGKHHSLHPSVDPNERIKEVVYAARWKDEIIGVTTAVLTKVPSLNNNLLYTFRGMIVPDKRIPGLFFRLAEMTYKYLHEKPILSSGHKPIGLIAEMENPSFRNMKLTKTLTGFILIGFSKRKNPIYVRYFEKANFL
jgi:hypothetical protein